MVYARQKTGAALCGSGKSYARSLRSLLVTYTEVYRDRISCPNIIRRASWTRRAPTWSVILIVRPIAIHTGDVRRTLDRQRHVIVRVREHVVMVNCRIVADAFDQVDGFLAAPTDRPMTTAACGHEYGFA